MPWAHPPRQFRRGHFDRPDWPPSSSCSSLPSRGALATADLSLAHSLASSRMIYLRGHSRQPFQMGFFLLLKISFFLSSLTCFCYSCTSNYSSHRKRLLPCSVLLAAGLVYTFPHRAPFFREGPPAQGSCRLLFLPPGRRELSRGLWGQQWGPASSSPPHSHTPPLGDSPSSPL